MGTLDFVVALETHNIGSPITGLVVLHTALHTIDQSFSLKSDFFAFVTFIIFRTVSQMIVLVSSFFVELSYAGLTAPFVFILFFETAF